MCLMLSVAFCKLAGSLHPSCSIVSPASYPAYFCTLPMLYIASTAADSMTDLSLQGERVWQVDQLVLLAL